jgi:thiamine-monophosphate kinase
LAFTLALSLPEADEGWLEPFARGMFALADAYGCELVGGDTTRGPLNICITVFGEVPPGRALLRSGAQVGDDIWVSGTIGDARLALEALQGHAYLPPHLLQAARLRLEQPSPRLALGLALRGLATAAADVSDGLVGDLGHILGSSGVGAEIDLNAAIKLIAANVEDTGAEDQLGFKISKTRILNYILNGGDDYELVFTAPPTQRTAVRAAGVDTKTPVTRIGSIVAKAGLRLRDGKGKLSKYTSKSFNHFADSAKHTINHSYDSIFQEDI